MEEIKILMIDNIFLGGSGGETHLLKMYEHWNLIPNIKVRLLIPKTSKLLKTKNSISIIIEIIIIYATRIMKTCLMHLNNKFDLIVTSSHYPPDVLPVLFLRFTNRKSKVVVYHHGISIPPEHGILLRSLSVMYNYFGTLLAIHFADLVFIINRSTEALLLHLGVKPEKMKITSNGVNIEDLSSVVGGKSFDACFIGRLVRSKGTSDLVKVWKKVCEKRKNARLAIIGGGPEKERINDLIMKMGLKNNITLLGPIFGDEKYEILKSSKVFLFPSHLESWGIAVAEAMASGLPVVAYDLPIYREVFEDKLITVPLGNVEAMAEKVIFLLENPSVAKEIGEAGREFVRRYDWSIVAERELSVIESLFKRKLR